jgi:hypothetical protein
VIIEMEPPSREAMSDEEYDATDRGLAPVVPLRPKAGREGWTYCKACEHVLSPYYAKCPTCTGDKNRLQVDRLNEVIRELKESVNGSIDPERERELVKMLELYSHPAPKEFLSWLASSRDQARSQPQRGRRR